MQGNAGLRAHELARGTMISGRRVVDLRPGMRSGARVITVFVEGTPNRRGRVRPVELGVFTLGAIVPGTRTPTTWAMPAGPVERKPGTRLGGGWYGDHDDSGARAARHHRLIESITYAGA